MKKTIAYALLALFAPILCAATIMEQPKAFLECKSPNGSLKIRHKLEDFGKFLRLRIPVSEARKLASIKITPDFASARAGDDGYIVLPSGMLTEFKEREDASFALNRPIMPIAGMKGPSGAFLAVVEGMKFEYKPVVSVRQGVYSLSHIFKIDGEPYEDIVIDYYPLQGKDANYSGMGRLYRQMKLRSIKPLRDRVGANKYLDYAANSLEFRIRQGWKPAPSPVKDQNLQNEPKMYVKATFDRVGELLDALKARGVDKAQVCLVGWNRKGHDGRYPQIFPVEPQLGGEAKLRALISKAKSMGYQIVAHTNPTSCYPVSELWDESYVAKTKDGKIWERPVKHPWSGGRSYFMCMKTSFERFAKSDFPKIRDLGFEGLHYLDVVSIVPPQPCYDINHYCNTKQSAHYCNELMKLAKQTFGGAQSEGGFDHVAANTDFALYVSFNILGAQPKIVDKVVPIWQIVYHGIILSNPSSETVNYTAKDKKTVMKNLEFGARPTFYMYSAFYEGGKAKNWMGDTDIRCGTQKEFDAAVDAIAKGYEDVKKYSYLQLEYLDEHRELAKDVFRCKYSDGSEMIFNYSSSPFVYGDMEIAPMSYALKKPDSFWKRISTWF